MNNYNKSLMACKYIYQNKKAILCPVIMSPSGLDRAKSNLSHIQMSYTNGKGRPNRLILPVTLLATFGVR